MPHHLAHFIHRYPPALGGAEAYFERLSQFFQASGDSVTVWTSTAIELREMFSRESSERRVETRRGSDGEKRDSAGFHPPLGEVVHRYRTLSFPLRRYVLKALSLIPIRPWQLLTSPSNPICPAMWKAVNEFTGPLDAVHATAFPYGFPMLCGLKLARKRKVPFFLTPFLHLGDPSDPRDKTRKQYTTPALVWLLKQAEKVFVQTPSEFQLAAKLGVPKNRLVLQGLGVEPSECTGGNREQARKEWGIGEGEFVVGHLANNSVEKGTVDLLKALKPNQGMRIVLAGPTMPNFEMFWNDYPHRDSIVRIGRLNETQKRNFFAGIDAFALPSRTDSFGLVLLEAWANDKPVLAYRAGGPVDLVRDGEDGFLVPCGNVLALSERLREWKNDPTRAAAMGEAGRLRCAKEFNWADKLEIVRKAMFGESEVL